MNMEVEGDGAIDNKLLDWKKLETLDILKEKEEFYYFYRGPPPERTLDFDKLVPMDLENTVAPGQLAADQLQMILPAIAQISLQGLSQINWPFLRRATSVKDMSLACFRDKVFTTLTKLVLNIFDIEDFQRYADEVNINKSCKFFGDHLRHIYGIAPKSYEKAMKAISKGELNLNEFPYLREQDVAFTLGKYCMNCTESERLKQDEFDLHEEVRRWPYIWTPVKKHFLVSEHHVSSVMKAVKEYVPLTVEEKMKVMKDLEKDCDRFVGSLCLEPWKDIQVEDFDIFETKPCRLHHDSIIGPFFSAISILTYRKAEVLRMSQKNVMFPMESGVFGMFSDEVLDVVGNANLERTRLGQRFLSGKLILWAIIRKSRIADRVGYFLNEWDGAITLEHDILEENIPCYYIYSFAHEVAKIQGSLHNRNIEKYYQYMPSHVSGQYWTVKLEHMVIAIVLTMYFKGETALSQIRLPSVIMFLEACYSDSVSGASPPRSLKEKEMKYTEEQELLEHMKTPPSPSSPEKKKVKYTEGQELLEHMETPPSPEKSDKLLRYESFILWLFGPEVPNINSVLKYVSFLNDALIKKSIDPRKRVFGLI